MLFDKIANAVTKHYKAIIAIWIVALLVAVPAILRVDEAIQYSSNFGASGDYESTQAQDIIDANFQQSVANSTLLVVIQSNDVTDQATRDFVLDLQNRIQSDSDVKFLQNVSSLYSYSSLAMNQAITQLAPNMNAGVQQAEPQVDQTASMLWGIPANYLQIRQAAGGDDTTANTTMIAQLNQQITDANQKQLALGYYSAFFQAWTGLSSVTDNTTRATQAVNAAAPTFIDNLPAEQRSLMTAVLNGFNLSNYNNATAIHEFTVNTVIAQTSSTAGITDTAFLRQVLDLGATPDPAAVSALADSIVSNRTVAEYPIALPEQLVSSFMSSNHRTMLLTISFTQDSTYTEDDGSKPLQNDVSYIRDDIKDLKAQTHADVTTYVTGDAAISQDMQETSSNDMTMIEPITIVIILVLMGILFRSVVGQFLPLGAVGVALGISQALVFIIGTTVAQIDSTTTTLLFAILMGVGTDYSIFIVTRYREERIRGATREQAVHTSVSWAGESIATSGATVIIAFFAMATASFAMVQTMGLLLGLAIIVALLVALTLVPSVIMLVGNRMFWPTTGKRFDQFATKLMERKKAGNHGYFHKAASFAVKHAAVVVLAAILVSVPTTYIYLTQETSFDFIGTMGHPESVQGMNAMTEDFGAGGIMPTQIVITGDTLVYNTTTGQFDPAYLDAVDNITATIAADSHVEKVTGVTRPFGTAVDYRDPALSTDNRTAMLADIGSDGKSVMLTVVLKDQPQAASSVSWISDLRQEVADAKAGQPALASSQILVGGSTASLYDMGKDTTQQFTNIEMLVILGIFIVLMLVLGSLLLPLFGVISVAMSITWSFALTSLVFGGWLNLPILWIIPLVLFVMLMGIGMDYNVFIMTRIREEVHKGKDPKTAVVDAVDWTGGIITALAMIMAGAFGSMMISSNAMLQEFGFALLFAVLLDAMVVRTYVVPAVIVLMGKWAWWAPGRLQREGRREKMEAKKKEPLEAKQE